MSTAQLPARPAPAGEVPAQVRGAARGGLVNLVGAVTGALGGFGVTWLVARALGPGHAGGFFAATAAFTMLGTVAKLGTETGLVYFTARLRAGAHPGRLRHCLRVALLPVLVAAVAIGLGLWCAAPVLARLSERDGAGGYVTQLRVLAVFLPAGVFSDTLLAGTRGWRRMRPTVVLDKVLRPAAQLVLIGLCLLVAGPGPAVLALAWAAPYLPSALLAGYALHRLLPAGWTPARREPDAAHPGPEWAAPGREPAGPTVVASWTTAPQPAAGPAPQFTAETQPRFTAETQPRFTAETQPRFTAETFWRFTAPRAAASVAQLALGRIDVLLVAGLAGLRAAAVYAVAGRFIVLGQFANQAISQAVQPRLAELLAREDRTGARALYQTATGWLVLTAWPLYLGLAAFPSVYLGLFGPGYRSATAVVVVLALAMVVATGCGMVDMVLAMAGRTSWNLANVVGALGVNLAMDWVLIPRLGPLGAAIGLATSIAANNLVPLAQLGVGLRLHPFGRGTCTAAGLAALFFGVLPMTLARLFGDSPGSAVAAALLALAGYLVAVSRLRHALRLDFFLALRARRST